MKRIAAVLAMLAITACEGPMGPEGPEGPQGPAGEPHYFSAHSDSQGGAVAQLPPEAGTLNDPPALTCYMREPGGVIWLVVAVDLTYQIGCGVASVGGGLAAQLVGAPPGYDVLFVAVY